MKQTSLQQPLRVCTWVVYSMLVFAPQQSMANAKNVADIQITLQSAIKHTLANAPELHEFTFKQKVVEAEIQTASLKPAFNAGIELENVLGSGEMSGIKGAELTLTLSSVIEFGDKLKVRSKFAKSKSTVIAAQKRVNTLDILAEVTRRYIEVLAQQALLDAQKEAEALARYTYQAVTKRVDAGASPAFEQKRASSALARARLEVLTAEQSKTSLIKSLAIMWGEQTPTFTQVQGDLFKLPPSPALEALFSQVLASPNLEIYVQQARLQEAQVRLSQTSNQADLTWTAGIRRNNGIAETGFVAGVNMPLFTSERNLGYYQKQKALLEQVAAQKQSATLTLYHQLNMALSARNNALLTVETLQNSIIPPLQEALTWVEQTYIDGRFSYLEWVSTSQELLNAKQALIHAAKQVHQRGADIESLTAVPLVSSLNTSLSSNTQ